MTTEFLHNFISKHKFAVLSTVSEDNSAQAAAVGIVASNDLRIFFDTVTTSRKYKNLSSNSSIAFVIGWEDGKTIQYEGIARIPNETELQEFLELYFSVFPDGIERNEQWKDITYFLVQPRWIRFSDFTATPQHIEEITF